MSLAEQIGPDEGGDDMFAAEYVLGVLPVDDRKHATHRIETEQAFARLVERWEAYFDPLSDDYESIDAPDTIKPAVDRRLFPEGASVDGAQAAASGLLGSIAFWRGLAVAALLLLAFIAIPSMLDRSSDVAPVRLAATIAPDGDSAVQYMAIYDEHTDDIGLSRLSGHPAEGRDFELWVIEGSNPPISLGVIPAGESSPRLPVSEAQRRWIAPGSVFAITDEPAGGSSSGLPTGAVVAKGYLTTI